MRRPFPSTTLAALPSIFGQAQAPAANQGHPTNQGYYETVMQRGMDGPAAVPQMNPAAPRAQSRFSLGSFGTIADIAPHLKALKDQIAHQYLSKNMIEGGYFSGDNLGRTTDEIQQGEKEEELAYRAHEFVQQSAHLSDEEFQAAKAQLLMELGMQTEQEEIGLQQPNALQRGVSGLAAALMPDQAFQSLAAPYAYELSEQDRKRKMAVEKAETARKTKADRMNSMIDLARLENERNIAGIRAQSAMDVAGIRAESQQNIAAVNQALRQMGLNLDALGLQLKERELNEVKIPDSQSRRAVNSARIQEIGAKIQHYGKLGQKIDADISRIATQKGLDSARTSLIKKQVAWFDQDKQADIGTKLARTAVLQEMMQFRWADLAQDKQISTLRVYGDTLNDLLDSYGSQITSINGIRDDLMNAIADDRFLNNGKLSPQGQEYANEYNRLREAVYGEEGLAKKAQGFQQQLNELSSQARRMSQGQVQYRQDAQGNFVPQAQGGGGGITYQMGPDGTFRPTQPRRQGPQQAPSRSGDRSGRGGRINPGPAVEAARKAGFSGEGLVTAVAIAMAESRGNPSARNSNAGTGDDSHGLWQINYYGNLSESRTKRFGPKEKMADPFENAKAAYHISGGGKNFKAWTTYTNGKYKQYLQAARDAIAASQK